MLFMGNLALLYLTSGVFLSAVALTLTFSAPAGDATIDVWGNWIIVAMSGSFLIVIGLFVYAARSSSEESAGLTLTYQADGNVVRFRPPRHGDEGFHAFLSHVWKYGQDQVATIKSMMTTMVSEAKIFLDVDNLDDIGKLEHYIEASDVIVVLLTRDYLSSKNCRRELLETFRIEKPLLLIVETDPGKGAVSLASLEAEVAMLAKRKTPPAELAAAQRLVDMYRNGIFVEWLREKPFKLAAMKRIATILLGEQARSLGATKIDAASSEERGAIIGSTGTPARRGVRGTHQTKVAADALREESEHRGRRRLQIAHEIRLPAGAGRRLLLYLSHHYRSLPPGAPPGESIYEQIERQLGTSDLGVQVRSTALLSSTAFLSHS